MWSVGGGQPLEGGGGLRRLLRPPRGDLSESEYLELRLVAVASFVLFIFSGIVTLVFPFISGFSPLDSFINIVGGIGLAAVYVLAMRGQRQASSRLLILTVFATVWANMWRNIDGPGHEAVILANLVPIALAFMLGRRAMGAVAVTATLGYIAWHAWLVPHGPGEMASLAIIFLAIAAVVGTGAMLRSKEVHRAVAAEQGQALIQADFRGLFDNMTEGVARCHAIFQKGELVDWEYLRVNQAFGPLTGLDDAVGKRVSDLIPGIRASNPELFELYGRVARGGPPEKIEVRIPELNRWFTVTAHHAGPDEFVAVFDNITSRKQAEEALRESESRLRSLLDNLDEGFVSADLVANTTMNSAGVARIFGHPLAAYNANPMLWSSQLHPDDAGRVLARYGRLLAGESTVDDTRIIRPDGGLRWVRATMHPIKDAVGKVVRLEGILRDITAEREAEERRTQLQDKDREVQRLTDLAKMRMEFLYNAAHDLKTPLTPLKLQLATWRRTANLDPTQLERLDRIDRNVARFQVLVDDMLDAARLQNGSLRLRPQAVALAPLVTEAAASFEEPAKQGDVALEVEALPTVSIEADPAKAMQVLLNVVSNAVKYTPPGGHVRIRAEVAANEAIVSVQDTGLGFTADQLSRLFTPFGRLHENLPGTAKGTGLGLYICKGILEQHGGRIWAESPGMNQGSTFFMAWPLAGATTLQPAVP